ncbi:hypothetical protein RZE82_00385 [Mollicutes bacterium LVI A0039]|nr:hypothetical protein RZE82_00385 [Mollicutes bacterium LVI A0039]
MFLIFEGIDGSGKSTHIKKLYELLSKMGVDVDISKGDLASKEAPIASLFTKLLKGEQFPSNELSLLMKMANLKYLYEYNATSQIYIFDRHIFSIYSDMYALGVDIDKYDDLFKMFNKIDRVYYFNTSPYDTYKRKEGKVTYAETGGPTYSVNGEITKDNFIKFQNDIKKGFELGLSKYVDPAKIVQLEGTNSIEENFAIIEADIISLLESAKGINDK